MSYKCSKCFSVINNIDFEGKAPETNNNIIDVSCAFRYYCQTCRHEGYVNHEFHKKAINLVRNNKESIINKSIESVVETYPETIFYKYKVKDPDTNKIYIINDY